MVMSITVMSVKVSMLFTWTRLPRNMIYSRRIEQVNTHNAEEMGTKTLASKGKKGKYVPENPNKHGQSQHYMENME